MTTGNDNLYKTDPCPPWRAEASAKAADPCLEKQPMRTYTIGPLRRVLHRGVESFFPPVCPVCMKALWRPEDGQVCAQCQEDLKAISAPFCIRCGLPFSDSGPHECGDCLADPPSFRTMRAAYIYQGALRQAILRFKMNRETSRDGPLAGLLLATEPLGIDWESYDLVLPVPLHDNRIRWRGYNQSALMVRQVARMRRIAWTDQLLVRRRDTTPQFSVERAKRKENIKGAFICADKEGVSRMSVLMVDDITTTGSTIRECAKVLREAGASVVDGAVLARAIPE